jgi:hypothetical protein
MTTLQQLLEEAEKAHHRLLTGAAVQEVTDANGEHIRYFQSDIGKLELYIGQLRARLTGHRPVREIRFSTSKGI